MASSMKKIVRLCIRPLTWCLTVFPWGSVFDWFMFLLGPCLISIASSLVSWVIYAGLKYILPIKADVMSLEWCIHVFLAIYLGFNIFFNYACCAMTNPGTHDTPAYARLLSEARKAGDVDHAGGVSDEDEEEGGGVGGRNSKGGWMERGPYEWGFCAFSRMPKPPRSHYCHISKKLVLNMDHYCPWMFNCVGYRNYRHFVLFMMYVWLGCLYVGLETLGPFMAFTHRRRRSVVGKHSDTGDRIKLMITGGVERDVTHHEWSTAARNITFTFIITLSIGIAVTLLLSFHLYLTLSAQTTIEFYGNRLKAWKARRRGEVWSNPYDFGMKRNWQHVFGPGHPLIAIMPSRRERPWPPYPQCAAKVSHDYSV